MMAAGEHPKVVQERLGHSSITLTLDTYTHVVPGMQELADPLVVTVQAGFPTGPRGLPAAGSRR